MRISPISNFFTNQLTGYQASRPTGYQAVSDSRRAAEVQGFVKRVEAIHPRRGMARREVAEKFAQVPPQRFSVQRDSEDEGIFSDKWWANLFHSCTEVPLLKALEFFVGNPPQKPATAACRIKKLALA